MTDLESWHAAERDIDRLQDERDRLRAEWEWRDISTAPKDGTQVLWFIDFGDGLPTHYVVGRYVDDHRGFCVKPDDDCGSTWNLRGAKAWMPLPPPPRG